MDGNNVVFDPGTAFEHLAEGASETVTLQYSVTDEHGAASSSTVQLTITGENDAPLAMADTSTGGENQRLAMDVLANDTDLDDGHVLTLVSAAAPDGKGTTTIDSNKILFDPGTTFEHLAQGESETVRLAYTMQDEHGAASSSFIDVTVTGQNDAPVAVADNAAGDENEVLTLDVLANDTDADDGHALTVVAANAPTGFGIASIVGNEVVFSPGSDFDRLPAGANETVQLSYTMQDDRGAQSSSTIAITLNGVNDAPVARDDSATTDEDTAANGNVLTDANGGPDSDVDGDVLSVTTVGTFSTALGGSITLSANGAFTYDATGSSTLQALNAGQSAVDSFTYSISDGKGGTSSATLSVDVAGANEPTKGSTVLSSIESGTALDYYIRFDGDGVANSWLKVGGFGHGFTDAGGTAGKITLSDMAAQLGSNSAMPHLLEMLGNDTHLNSVEIEAYTQGTSQLVDQYVFSDAVLTHLQASNDGFGTTDAVSFDFGSFAHSHQQFDAKGTPGAVTAAAWDFVNAKPTSAPAHTADALVGTLGDALPTYSPLKYFMTYDGAPGWVEVSSFSTGTSGGTGSAAAEEAKLGLGSSEQLIQLTQALLSGTQLKSVEVEAYRIDGAQPQLVDEYKFQDVNLSELYTWNATQNSLSFDYAKYAEGHVAYDANGAPGSITTGGWDFGNNTAFSGGTPSGDAIGNLLAGGVSPDTSLDYYIRFDGAGVANSWLKLGSFNHSLDAGLAVGKVSASAVDGTLGSNSAMPDLFEMLANGTHLNGVEIEAYSNQGAPQLVDQYFFSNAVLTDLQVDGSADSVDFDFTGFAHSHQEINATGVLGPVASIGWDFVNAAPGSIPPHQADAAAAKQLADSLSSDVPLKYFVTYDGAPGWLEVSSFKTGMSGGNGQATAEEAMVTLGSSNQLVQLTGMLLSGQQLKGIEVEAYRMDGAQPRLVDEYKFQDVTLTNLAATNANANGLSFDYVKYAEGHIGYTTGAPSTVTTGGWDFSSNSAFSGGTPVADAIGKQLTGGVAPGMDGLDYYIRFDTAGVLNSWMKLGAFSHTFGEGAGTLDATDVAGTLGSNSAMPSLVEMLGNGTHLNGVEIEAYREGSTQLVDQYFFSDAVVTRVGVDGSAGFTFDSVNFGFGGFAHSHQDLDAKGAPGPVASVGWDFVNAAAGSVPAHNADALSGPLGDALPLDASLAYFMTYAGAPGWLQVSSFSTGMSGGTGPATADEVMLSLGSSKQLVELTQALLSGKQLSSLEVEAYRMDGAQPKLVDEYQFQDVILNGLSTDGSATQNTLSFSYGTYAEGHIAYDVNGAQSSITTGGWDFTHNTAFSGGTPHGDIDFTA